MQERNVNRIAIIGAGDMGSGVAAELLENGFDVATCLKGRSQRSRKLAERAGIRNVGDYETLAADADMLLSIVPPTAAIAVAREIVPFIRDSASKALYVECNAVAPSTVRKIAETAANHEVDFQDAGIVGAPPRAGRPAVRVYTSGPHEDGLRRITTERIDVKPLGTEIGRASAMKMVYASLTKGTNALRAAAILTARQLGVSEELGKELAHSLPEVHEAMRNRMPNIACDAARWTGEMREIAATYEAVGLTSRFHEGAEWIYELLSHSTIADESRDEANSRKRNLEEVTEIYHRTLLDQLGEHLP